MKKVSQVSYVVFMMIGLLMMAAGSFVDLAKFDAFLSVTRIFAMKDITNSLCSMFPDGSPFHWCGGILIIANTLFYFLTSGGNAGWFDGEKKPDKEGSPAEKEQ